MSGFFKRLVTGDKERRDATTKAVLEDLASRITDDDVRAALDEIEQAEHLPKKERKKYDAEIVRKERYVKTMFKRDWKKKWKEMFGQQ